MKKRTKTAGVLLALCLAVSTLCIRASAMVDGSYGIVLYTAERSVQLPQNGIAALSTVSSGSFTFPSPGESKSGFVTGRPGFTFAGWKAEGEDTIYQPGDVIEVTQDLTFYGQWTAAYPFTDLDENADYFYDVISVYEQGLLTGTSATTFSPNDTFTRAMMWTVLARMHGEEISGNGWVEQARAWVMENGVSDGASPDQAITRQELATMLYRQAGSPSVDGLNYLNGFLDKSETAVWAQDAMNWALQTGVMDGDRLHAVLNPADAVTRAEVASAVVQFGEWTESGAETE